MYLMSRFKICIKLCTTYVHNLTYLLDSTLFLYQFHFYSSIYVSGFDESLSYRIKWEIDLIDSPVL